MSSLHFSEEALTNDINNMIMNTDQGQSIDSSTAHFQTTTGMTYTRLHYIQIWLLVGPSHHA